MQASPRQVLGNYVIERELGRGGMGAIYLGVHQTLGKRVAIKVLLPELSRREDLIARFWAEARAVTAIKHASIVDVYDYGVTDDGHTFIVMEYLEGESLGARLKARGLLPIPHAVAIARQIASALAAAHAVGVVHRDLKPDNIFLVEDSEVAGGWRAKLLDFGVAKLVASETAGTAQTITGALLGTPHYMSPEQCEGARAVDHRSDLYSLGCTLFQMVAGRLPFESAGVGGLIGMHLHVPPPKLRDRAPHASDELERIVARLLEKQPDARFASAGVLAAALSSAEASAVDAAASAPLPRQIVQADLATAVSRFEEPPLARTELAPPKPSPPQPVNSTRTRWAWLSASVGLVGIVAIAVIANRDDSRTNSSIDQGTTTEVVDAGARGGETDAQPSPSEDKSTIARRIVEASDQRNWLRVGELARSLEATGATREEIDELLATMSKQATADIEQRIAKLVAAGDCVTAILEAQQFTLGWGKYGTRAIEIAAACDDDDTTEIESEARDEIEEAVMESNFRLAYTKCKARKQLSAELALFCVAAACEMKQTASARLWAKPLPTELLGEVIDECAKRGVQIGPATN